jgi:hypothetical protein
MNDPARKFADLIAVAYPQTEGQSWVAIEAMTVKQLQELLGWPAQRSRDLLLQACRNRKITGWFQS